MQNGFECGWTTESYHGKVIDLNTIGVVCAIPHTFVGKVRLGQRLECFDVRWQRTDGFQIYLFRDGRGNTVSMRASEAHRCMRALSGPRRDTKVD